MHRLLTFLGLAFAPAMLGADALEYEGALYQVYRVPVAHQSRLHLRWLDDAGKPLSNFGALQQQLDREGKKIAFATNAGIYEQGPKPCGLTICDGKELVPLNLADGEGNFFLKPNGVFYLDDQTGPGIVEAGEYPSLTIKPRLANQSGPLILRKGVIHPAFNANSPNLRQRSAVGVVTKTKEIVFVMSDREDRVKGRVTFHQLARHFLHLGCQDALYLDGDISQMITSPAPGTKFTPNTFAGMFVVTE
ncbi:MAG: phosphodiester glycosidase family protein [Prosthecobacter sp.]